MIDREMEECPRKKQKMRLARLRKETVEQIHAANDALKQSGLTKLAIHTCKESLREKAKRLVQYKRASKRKDELVLLDPARRAVDLHAARGLQNGQHLPRLRCGGNASW